MKPAPAGLERSVLRFRSHRGRSADLSGLKAAAFRAAVEERLRSLDDDVHELKGRLNGLIFVVLGAVVTQVILKLLS